MRIRWVIWNDYFLNKIRRKHAVTEAEVEQVLRRSHLFRKAETGKVPGEDLYIAHGQTDAGRYLLVLFIMKPPDGALPISARDMTKPERRYYGKRKKSR
jgi:uncharacterized DUF497 family protein